MAAAAATEASQRGGTTFAFAGGAGAADDFRQAPERSEEHFKVAGASPSAAGATRLVALPTTSEATGTSTTNTVTTTASNTTVSGTGARMSPAAAAAGADAASAPASTPSRAATSAAAPAASLPASAVASASGPAAPALPLNPGETALLEYRKLGRIYQDKGLTDFFLPNVAEEDLDQFGWQEALRITVEPLPWTLPTEALSFKPTPDDIHKFFFKDTPHEVCIRQIFFHVPLSVDEQQWLQQFREKCTACNWTIPFFLEPHVLRIVWFCKRKYPEDSINKSLEHAQLMVEWRRQLYPICDSETDLRKLLDMGVMYWVGRDASLRPLLVVRLARLPKTTPPELFKRLTIFCFEWSLRFLMVPGVVETCVVLFDVRTVPLHQFPISALTDMVTTLTKQFPFRLHRMWIINDSFFVQTAWNIVKQFLTDVQQQKIRFYRTGFETELLKEYAPHQLEKHYGGSRELTEFYPFPLAPGPFTLAAPPPPTTLPAVPPWKASDRYTTFGVVWEDKCRVPLQWAGGEAAKEVFRAAGLPPPPPPITLQDERVAKALEAVEKATLAQRTSGILSYKSMVQRLSTAGGKRSLLWQSGGDGLSDAAVSPRTAESSFPYRAEARGLVGTEISKRLSTVQYTPVVSDTDAYPLEAIGVTASGSAATAAAADAAPHTVKDASHDSVDRQSNAEPAVADPQSALTDLSAHKTSPADAAISEAQAHEKPSAGQTAPEQRHNEVAPSKQVSKEASVAARTSGVDASLPPVEKVRTGLCCRRCRVR